MSIAPETLILLDTSVVIHVARNDQIGQTIESQYALTSRKDRPLISSITEGELFGLAYFNRWGSPKLQALRDLLANLVSVDAGLPAVVQSYARLYAEARRSGNPCGQNDLWIAASAQAVEAVLLTCDKDFDWLNPNYLKVFRVP